MPRTPFPPTVHSHHWRGFRYESRMALSASPRYDPVVLVGGALHRKEDWGSLEQALLAHADVVCPDLPGWGAADHLPPGHGADLLAEALGNLLDDLGIRRANVFAGSYGTAVAYRLAQLQPDRVTRMVLAGTMSTIPDNARASMRAAIELAASRDRDRFGPTAVEHLMCHDPAADIASAKVVARIISRRFGSVDDDEIAMFVANTRRLLDSVLIDVTVAPEVPTLFTVGQHDTLTAPALCRELAMTCTNSWFVEMARADHLVHLERPRELADLMMRFFADEPLVSLPYATRIEDLTATRALEAAVKAAPVGV